MTIHIPENISVLLIDDEPGIARLISKKLTNRGWKVDTAPNGKKGIEKYLDKEYDVVLVDYDMPGLNGIEVIEKLKENDNTPPLIMVTGAGNESTAVEALRLGIDDYVVKDLDGVFTELMVNVVEKALTRRIETRDKKKFERQLEQSKEKYQNLIENLNEIVFNLDRDGIFTYVSPVVKTYYQYDPEELVGKHFSEMIYEEDYPEREKGFLNIDNGTIDPSEFRILDKDGNVHHVQTSSRQLYHDGEIVGLTGILRDITELRIAHTELESKTKELGDRVKELNCLYKISNFIEKNERLEDIFQAIVDIIPPSWQYPEKTCARITVEDIVKTSTPFEETGWCQTRDITIPGRKSGSIAVSSWECLLIPERARF
jgi:PAS domain S-box-containing protein